MSLERVVTAGLRLPQHSAIEFEFLMAELRRLVETAGGVVVKEIIQCRPRKEPATLLGRGKIAEMAGLIKDLGVKTVVFDDDLTAAQQKNVEKILSAKVVDRTRLILDIFSQRARTKEGQLQVELAQLNYLVPRLTGAWRGFSQQVGGIGMRGPGERKIEVERRYVRERIKRLKGEIEEIRRHRGRARIGRAVVPLPQVAIVGYTNTGKSTLLNKLVGEKVVYADDLLFATLDPTTRRVKLPSGRTVLFTDTVGFIQKLPVDLVAAFRATLEEVSESSILLHVVDSTAPNRDHQKKTVLEVVKSLEAQEIPMITAYNKADLLDPSERERIVRKKDLLLSGCTGEGLKELLILIEKKLDEVLLEKSFKLPYSLRKLMPALFRTGHILEQRYEEDGVQVTMLIDPGNWAKILYQLESVQ